MSNSRGLGRRLQWFLDLATVPSGYSVSYLILAPANPPRLETLSHLARDTQFASQLAPHKLQNVCLCLSVLFVPLACFNPSPIVTSAP